jgi:DNA-binding GntR family transcriptional regulator
MAKSPSSNGWAKPAQRRGGRAPDKESGGKSTGKTAMTPARVYDQLRLRIATRAYPPGARLSESDLATEFGLSRTPVRQALQLLEAGGLVRIRNGVGVTVTDLDRAEIDQAYALRCELAAMIGRHSPKPLAHHQMAELESIRQGVIDLLRRKEQPSVEQFAELCERFHNTVNNVIGARMLRSFVDTLYHQTDRFWYGWMEQADIRTEVTHFLHEVEETQRALEIEDFQAVGYIRRNHITMMLARMAQVRETESRS